MASVLMAKYGQFKNPPQALSEDSGTTWRAARNHLSGENSMQLADFFNACQTIPELKQWGLRMMGAEAHLSLQFDAEMQALIRAYYAIKDREGEHV
jgi:hypothetical protein